MEDGWSRRCRSTAAVRSVRSVTTSWRSSFPKTVVVPWRPKRPKLCVYRSIGWRRQKTFLKSSVSSRLCPARNSATHSGGIPRYSASLPSGSIGRRLEGALALQNLFCNLDPQQSADVLDLIGDHRLSGTSEQQSDRDVVECHDQRAGVAPCRHVRSDDLVFHAPYPAAIIVDVDGRVHRCDAAGGEIGGAAGLLDRLADHLQHLRAPAPSAHVAAPVDLAVQIVEITLGHGAIDDVVLRWERHRGSQLNRNEAAELGDLVRRIHSAVDWSRLEDRSTDRASIDIRQDVIVAEDVELARDTDTVHRVVWIGRAAG